MDIRLGRISIYIGKIARGSNGENPPWRGYCWGSDWPRVRFSGYCAAYCLDLSWLCYFLSIYWNKKYRPTPEAKERT
jgi:hypothetical protein